MADHRLVITTRRQTGCGVGLTLIFTVLAAWIAVHV